MPHPPTRLKRCVPNSYKGMRRESTRIDVMEREKSMNHEKREKGSPVAQGRLSKVEKTLRYRTALGALVAMLLAAVAAMTATDEPQGWLVIEGGSYPLNPVVAQRFR